MKKKGVDGGFKILNFFGFRPLQCLLVGWVGVCVCVLSARALHHFLRVMDMSCHFSFDPLSLPHSWSV